MPGQPTSGRQSPERRSRSRLAIALEYPLMQQGGTEVLVRELIRGLSRHYELILVSGDQERENLSPEFQQIISGHFSWKRDQRGAGQAAQLAAKLFAEKIELAHFH